VFAAGRRSLQWTPEEWLLLLLLLVLLLVLLYQQQQLHSAWIL
jgi:hypothetical protein